MKNFLNNVTVNLVLCALLAITATAADLTGSAQSAQIRVDTRQGLFGGKLATGDEIVGEEDGSLLSEWDFDALELNGDATYEDGWYSRGLNDYEELDWFSEEIEDDPDILILNEPIVHGGRLTTNEVWTTDVVHVVRHNLVVPNGVTVTFDPETVVKYTEVARLVVEQGGTWIAKGAWLAEFQDDEWVGGDTNMDGTNSVATGTTDWITGLDEGADYVHVRLINGMTQAFPTRTYTKGTVYGALPTIDRYDEGYYFKGWVTNREETVGVAAETPAEMDCPFLYANWDAIYLNLATGLVEFAAYSLGVTKTVEVSANDSWVYETDAEWLHLERTMSLSSAEAAASLDYDGTISIAADSNRSETPRTAVIRVSRANGKLAHEITVVQAAMERAATPEIVTADGTTTFNSYNKQVEIRCVTPGVTIVYTTDGTEPSADNGTVAKTETLSEGGVHTYVVISDTVTVKAIALRYDLLDSKTAEASFTRGSTLAEAMDIPETTVSTDGDADWFVVTDETHDGVAAVRSGAMTTSRTKRRTSRLKTAFYGTGTLTFWWKVDCEEPWNDGDLLDYLGFYANEKLVAHIEGHGGGWQQVTVSFTEEDWHEVEWYYTKNDGFDDINPGEDCGWVDQVVWTPSVLNEDGREVYASRSFLQGLGLVGASSSDSEVAEAAKEDADGDGYTNEEEALLGTDPTDAESKLQITIEQNDEGFMSVDYTPENTSNGDHTLDYRIMGAKDLSDGKWENVTDQNDAERSLNGFKFFKVQVNVD